MIDGRLIQNKEELHQAFKQELDLPDWYGGNLDALHDCLTEKAYALQICHWDALKENLGDYADHLLIVLEEAAEKTLHLTLS